MSKLQHLDRRSVSTDCGWRLASFKSFFARFWQLLARPSKHAAATAILLASWSQLASAGTNGTWIDTASGGLWSNAANWSGATIADGTGGVADFSALNITAGNKVHLDSSRTIGTLKFGDTTPSNDWTLDNNGSSANVLTLGVSSGNPVIQVNNRTATISTILAGNQGFNAVGSGNLILAGANTLSGTATLSTSTLQLGNANALQNSTINYTGVR